MDERRYDPRRATRVAAAASMGTLLTLVGLVAGGKPSSATATPAESTPAVPDSTSPDATSPATAVPVAVVPITTVPVTTEPVTTVPCATTYTVQHGDYWLLLADESGTPISELYALNAAGPTTELFEGAQICLPAGATVVTTSTTIHVRPATTAPARAPSTTMPAAVSVATTTRASG